VEAVPLPPYRSPDDISTNRGDCDEGHHRTPRPTAGCSRNGQVLQVYASAALDTTAYVEHTNIVLEDDPVQVPTDLTPLTCPSNPLS